MCVFVCVVIYLFLLNAVHQKWHNKMDTNAGMWALEAVFVVQILIPLHLPIWGGNSAPLTLSFLFHKMNIIIVCTSGDYWKDQMTSCMLSVHMLFGPGM